VILKEDVLGCLKYLVQYKGYKKSHNQWLCAEEMMKQTKQNYAKYFKSRSQSSPFSKSLAKTSNRRWKRANEDAKAQASPSSKSSITAKRKGSGSESGVSDRVESKRKRQ
jgi:hypothetical protein